MGGPLQRDWERRAGVAGVVRRAMVELALGAGRD